MLKYLLLPFLLAATPGDSAEPDRMCTNLQLTLYPAELPQASRPQPSGEWSAAFDPGKWPVWAADLAARLEQLGATTVRGRDRGRCIWVSLPFACDRDDRWCRAIESELETLLVVDDAQFRYFGGYGFDLSGDRFFPYTHPPQLLAAPLRGLYPDSCEMCVVRVEVDSCGKASILSVDPEPSPDCLQIVEQIVPAWEFLPAIGGSGWTSQQIGVPLGGRSNKPIQLDRPPAGR